MRCGDGVPVGQHHSAAALSIAGPGCVLIILRLTNPHHYCPPRAAAATLLDAMTALMPPLSLRRAFHFFMLSMVFERSVVDSSVACFVNQSWFIAAAADGRFDGSTCKRDLMNNCASEETEDQ